MQTNEQPFVKIIEATFDQIPLLRDLGEQTFREAYTYETDTENMEQYIQANFTLERIQEEVQNSKTKYFLVKKKAKWAGYALVRWDRSHELLGTSKALMLHRIYLVQAFWGQNIGNFLLQYILNFAKSEGYEWLWLVVWAENKQALRFYEKWGFEHFGYIDFQYGAIVTKDWVMRKRVV